MSIPTHNTPTMTLTPPKTTAYIEIDFPPETEDPARIFRGMAALIEAFQFIDSDLAKQLGLEWEPVVVLQRIEAGSLRAHLATFFRQLDDDGLKNLQWQPFVGQYLVRANHAIIRFLDRGQPPPAAPDVLALRREMEELAQRELSGLRATVSIPVEALIEYLLRLSEAMAALKEGDRVRYSALGQEVEIEADFRLTLDDAARLRRECAPVARPQPWPVALNPVQGGDALRHAAGSGLVVRASRWVAAAFVVGLILLAVAKAISLARTGVPNP